MIEVFVRTFVMEDGDSIYERIKLIQNMPGYHGYMKAEDRTITADFYKKVI